MAFIGVFLVTTVTSLYPFALLQPLWQLRMADSLMNGASLPLMGAVMIVLSTRFSERSGPHKLLGAIRRLALVATMGVVSFFFLGDVLTQEFNFSNRPERGPDRQRWPR